MSAVCTCDCLYSSHLARSYNCLHAMMVDALRLSQLNFLVCIVCLCVHVNHQTADMSELWHDSLHIGISNLILNMTLLFMWIVKLLDRRTFQQDNVHSSIGHTSPLARAYKTGTGHRPSKIVTKKAMTVIKWMKVEGKVPLRTRT